MANLEQIRKEMIGASKRAARNRLPAVVPVMPFGRRFGYEENVAAPDPRGGMIGRDFARSTGVGMNGVAEPNRAAGVVHEGEEVIPADVVDALGGSGAVDEMIQDRLGTRVNTGEMPGYQAGTVDPYADDPVMRSRTLGVRGRGADPYAGDPSMSANRGTAGDPYAGDASMSTFRGVRGTGRGGADPYAGDTVMGAKNLGIGDTRTTPTGEAAGRPSFAGAGGAYAAGLRGVQDIAAGQSKVLDIQAQQARQRLAGRSAAERAAQDIVSSQRGVGDAAAATERAMLGRDLRSEAAQLEGDIAETGAREAAAATRELVRAGESGLRAREQQHQFDVKQAFEERRHDDVHTLNTQKYESQEMWNAANAAFNAGDYEGYARTLKENGIEVNPAWLQNQQKMDALYDAQNVLNDAATENLDFTDPGVYSALENWYRLDNPDYNPNDPAQKAAFEKWGQEKYDWKKTTANSAFPDLYSMPDEDYANIFRPTDAGPEWSIDQFQYAGLTGKKAAVKASIDLYNGGGMRFDNDGNLVVDTTAAIWDKIPGISVSDPLKAGYEEGKTITVDSLSATSPAVTAFTEAAAVGDTFTDVTGITYELGAGNTLKMVSAADFVADSPDAATAAVKGALGASEANVPAGQIRTVNKKLYQKQDDGTWAHVGSAGIASRVKRKDPTLPSGLDQYKDDAAGTIRRVDGKTYSKQKDGSWKHLGEATDTVDTLLEDWTSDPNTDEFDVGKDAMFSGRLIAPDGRLFTRKSPSDPWEEQEPLTAEYFSINPTSSDTIAAARAGNRDAVNAFRDALRTDMAFDQLAGISPNSAFFKESVDAAGLGTFNVNSDMTIGDWYVLDGIPVKVVNHSGVTYELMTYNGQRTTAKRGESDMEIKNRARGMASKGLGSASQGTGSGPSAGTRTTGGK